MLWFWNPSSKRSWSAFPAKAKHGTSYINKSSFKCFTSLLSSSHCSDVFIGHRYRQKLSTFICLMLSFGQAFPTMFHLSSLVYFLPANILCNQKCKYRKKYPLFFIRSTFNGKKSPQSFLSTLWRGRLTVLKRLQMCHHLVQTPSCTKIFARNHIK